MEKNPKNTPPGIYRGGLVPRLTGVLLVILFIIVTAAAAEDGQSFTNPTVIVSDYQVTPAVLLPGDKGMIT